MAIYSPIESPCQIDEKYAVSEIFEGNFSSIGFKIAVPNEIRGCLNFKVRIKLDTLFWFHTFFKL